MPLWDGFEVDFFGNLNAYVWLKIEQKTTTMYLVFLIVVWCGILQSTGVLCEFPGLRRPPNNWPGEQKDDSVEFLTRLRALMMEHNARLKLMQQLEQLTKEKEQLEQEVSYPVVDDNRKIEELPDVSDYTSVDASKESIFKSTQFAYSPTDPRYWYPESYVNKVKQQIKAQQPTGADDYESDNKKESETNSNAKSQQITQIDAVPTFNVKAPMIPNPKLHIPKQVKIDNNNNALETGNSDTKLQQQQQQQGVIQKPMNLDDGGIGILVVAMIAGVSAAITVAIIAAGLGYYTLRKKIKAAADVDYPAYGVTGPNKDLLYPNEKKFAQSVDMFHYQQQKQKKNSLENKSNGETNDGFSDLDGEFDMDDGDYTVYECPGFAPTGEMEVKNPLFADEPITAQIGCRNCGDEVGKNKEETKKQNKLFLRIHYPEARRRINEIATNSSLYSTLTSEDSELTDATKRQRKKTAALRQREAIKNLNTTTTAVNNIDDDLLIAQEERLTNLKHQAP
uniref:CSON011855 protein n=1 Tax=Culicoides sonorensis TaxID=179676 RepID=A0A336LJB9_CULSO